MSKVIKDNNGVTVVEGTPAASLVKDVDKFFAAKPRERMAGENIAQKRTLDPRAINIRRPTSKDLEQMNNPPVEKPAIRSGRRPSFENLSTQEQAEVTARREQMMEDRRARDPLPRRNVRDAARDNSGRDPNARRDFTKRNQAKDKAESRRKRFFERRRSRKEAKRSQREQEATQGKFITTLKR